MRHGRCAGGIKSEFDSENVLIGSRLMQYHQYLKYFSQPFIQKVLLFKLMRIIMFIVTFNEKRFLAGRTDGNSISHSVGPTLTEIFFSGIKTFVVPRR